MNTIICLTSKSSDEADLQALTRDLAATIREFTDCKAELAQGITKPGERGDPVTIGMIVLTFISSGAAVALIEVLKAYFDRDDKLAVSVESPDGHKVSITAENVSRTNIDKTVASLEALLRKTQIAKT